MPPALRYPGVYIEEVPSGVRTIVGVGTSVAAFVGRTEYGPTETPIVVNGYGDFEQKFGGLWKGSKLPYAVRDFFLNGGSQAVVVRLYLAEAQAVPVDPAKQPRTTFKIDNLSFKAAEPGSWGGSLRASVDVDVATSVADTMGLKASDLFNLTVWDSRPGGETERFVNVTVADGPRRVDRVLEEESTLIRWDGETASSNAIAELAKIATAHAKQAALTKAKAARAGADDEATKKAEKSAQSDLKEALADLVDPVTKAEQELKDAKPAEIEAKSKALTEVKEKFVASDGLDLDSNAFIGAGKEGSKQGLYALEKADLFNILCIPPYNDDDVDPDVVGAAARYCELRRAMLLVDPPKNWTDKEKAKDNLPRIGTANSKNAALFFPRLRQPDPLQNSRMREFVPSGAIAGIFARTDSARGVWKAPAGFEATLVGVADLSVPLTDLENGELNPLGINCLRTMPAAGRLVWGARTLQGDDRLASEWKYIPVRRTALFIEESLYRGTQWVVFEPNDEPLWSQIRLNIGAFMNDLFRQGAFQGRTPREAYFVKCDKETTTQSDINKGIVNIHVGFAPLKPAEFVVIKIQQIAGEIQT